MKKHLTKGHQVAIALDGAQNITAIESAKVYLDKNPSGWMVPYIVRCLYDLDDQFSARLWLDDWFSRHCGQIQPVLSMWDVLIGEFEEGKQDRVESGQDCPGDQDGNSSIEAVIKAAKELILSNAPDPRLGHLMLRLVRLRSDAEVLSIAEGWLSSNCFDHNSREVLDILISKCSDIESERRLNELIDNSDCFGIIVMLIRYRNSGVVTRAAKKFLLRYPGSYQGAFVLSSMIEVDRLANKRKWVKHWWSHASDDRGMIAQILIEYLKPPSISKSALSLACSVLRDGRTYIFSLPKDKRVLCEVELLIAEDKVSRKAEYLLKELIRVRCNQTTVSIALTWLQSNPIERHGSVIVELTGRSVHKTSDVILEYAIEYVEKLSDSEDAFIIACKLVELYPDRYVGFLKNWMSKDNFDVVYMLPRGAISILKVVHDEDVLHELNAWLDMVDRYAYFERYLLRYWLSSAYELLLDIDASEALERHKLA